MNFCRRETGTVSGGRVRRGRAFAFLFAAFLVSLLPGFANAQIVHEGTFTADSANLPASSLTVNNISSGTDQLYLASVTLYQTGVTVSSVSGGGLTWTLQKAFCSARISQPRVEIWQAFGSPGATFDTGITLSATAGVVSAAVSRYSGVDSTTPTEGAAGSNTNGQEGACDGTGVDSANLSLSLTSTVDNSVLFVVSHPRNNALTTEDADYTQRAFIANSDGGDGAYLYVHDRSLASAGTDSADHVRGSETDWDMAGLVINPATGGGPGVCPAPDLGGWYPGGWLYRKPLSIGANNVPSNLTNFPVLVSIPSDTDLAAQAQPDGDDILVTSSDGTTKLSHEIEKFDGATGELVAWVNVPTVSSTADTIIYMYYGNATAANQQNPTDVWSNGYAGVWHLHSNFNDSTANGNATTNNGSVNIAAKIADGQDFDGVDDVIRVPDSPSTSIEGNQFTLSAWVRPTDILGDGDAGIISKAHEPSSNVERYHLGIDRAGKVNVRRHSGSLARLDTNADDVVNNQWQYLVGRYDGSTLKGYVNGVEVGSASASGNIDSSAEDLIFGKRYNSRFYTGQIDEIRVANVPRSAAWFTTEYNNQNDPANFHSVCAEEIATAVTSADAEISPNNVETSSTANSFSYDIQVTISGSDTGVNRVAITVPGSFGAPTVSDVEVDGTPVAFTDNTAGNAISVDLTTKVTATSKITVLFDADAPTTQDLVGVSFTSTVDDSGTGEAAQATSQGNGDGDAGDNNSWVVTTTDILGLVAQWKFDEGSGQTAGDSTGNGHNATLGTSAGSDSADPAWECVSGGYALNFDGNDDIINAGSGAALDDLEPLTIMAWVKPDSAGSLGVSQIIARGTGNGRWFLERDNTSPETHAYEFNKEYDSTDLQRVSSNNAVTYDAWQHIAVSWDGSDTGSNVHIFKNGVETSYQTTVNGSTTKQSDAAIDLVMGNREDGSQPFYGLMDEVRIYDRVLTAGEIATLASTAPTACSNTAVTSAVAEISPNDVATSSTGNAFSYDIQATIDASDSGVNRVAITVPADFSNVAVSDVQVDGSPVAFTDNTIGNAISVDLSTKVTASSKITVLFDADAPTSQDLTGVDFLSTVDDSGTGGAAQDTTEGNGDGDSGDANSWTVTTTSASVGALSRWALDETSGTVAADVEAGHDGTYANAPMLGQGGACASTGSSVHFDGDTAGQYVEIAHHGDYMLDNGTVTLWVNVDQIPNPDTGSGAIHGLFSKDSQGFDNGGHLGIRILNDGSVSTRLQTTGSSNEVIGAAITAGTWAHIAFSWGSGGMKLYVDGAAPVTDPYTGGLGTTSGGSGNDEPITLGASQLQSDDGVVTPLWYHMVGYLDDVRIYDSELSHEEIQALAGCGGSAVTSALAEISPNDVATSSTGNAFSYDIQATIGGGDTGVDRVAITVPGNFGTPTVTDVLVDDVSVVYTDNTVGYAISVDLGTKLTANGKITVLFDADAPTSQDLTGSNFLSTVDDSGTVDPAQDTTEGDGDGDSGDANSWTVTTTDTSAEACVAIDGSASTGSTEAGSMTISHTTSGSDRLMLVGISIDNNQDETVSSVTYNGIGLSLVGTEFLSNDARVEIWQLTEAGGLTTGTHDVEITFSADLNQPAIAGVMTFTGVDQTTPLGTFASATNTSDAASVTVSSAVGELVYAIMSGETVTSVTTDAPATEHWNLSAVGSLITEFGAGATDDGAANVNMSWSLGSTDYWAAGGVPIKPSGNCNAAVTSAVAEISPNNVTTSSTGNAFSYDIEATFSGGDTGVDTVAITVPASFGVPTVTDVLVDDVSVAYTDNTSGQTISVVLTTKVTATSKITVLFSADAPTSEDLTGVDFVSTVDDAGSTDAAQATTEGNGDGDSGDNNSWTVTTTDGGGGGAVDPVVNSTGNASDATAGDGVCDTGGLNSQSATECTLRAAIQEANANAGLDTITFNMPTTEPGYSGTPLSYTIIPGSALPGISDQTVIDGTSQPGYGGTPIVIVDGDNMGASGIVLGPNGDNSTIRGLIIRDFGVNGIQVQAGSDGNLIAGNWIGRFNASGTDIGPGNENDTRGIEVLGSTTTIGGTTAADRNVISGNGGEGIIIRNGAADTIVRGNYIGTEADGTTALGNFQEGIQIDGGSPGTIIGGSAAGAGNVIGANGSTSGAGISISEDGTDDTVIQGNYIGTDETGTVDLGNVNSGIDVRGNGSAATSPLNTLIGGTSAGDGNVIRFNGRDGVRIRDVAVDVAILGNAIDRNDQIGIDLWPSNSDDDVTANDSGDGDSGSNELMNFPVITSAIGYSGNVDINFDADLPAGNYRVEFFKNPSGADGSGNGEGEEFIDFVNIAHGGSGTESFSHSFSGAVDDIVTATVTEELSGPTFRNTSEFSASYVVTAGEAVAAAVAEISPNDVATAGGIYSFEYDIAATIGAANTGVDRVAITVPASFGVNTLPVTNVLIDGASVAFTDNTVGNAISVDLASKVTTNARITVLFEISAPTAENLTGVDFTSTVDDSTTGDAAQAATEGNGDGDTEDNNSWTVTTTGSGGGVTAGLLSHWPLDETSGTTAADVGAFHDGTYTNGPTVNQAGACANTGTGVYFNGEAGGQYVVVPHDDDYLLDSGTVSLWVNLDEFPNPGSYPEHGIFSKDSLNLDTGGHLDMRVLSDGTVEVRLQSVDSDNLVTGPAISATTWHHIAFSWGTGGMKLYVDSGTPTTDAYTGGLGSTSGGIGNHEPIAFGASAYRSGNGVVTPLERFMKGYLDDVRIYNRALSDAEIQTLADCANAATSAVAEISPNNVTTNSTGNAFAYDIQTTISANNSGVDTIGITVPASFTMGSVTDVLVNGVSVSYTDNTVGNEISIELTTKLTSSARITILFTADAPTSEDPTGADFLSTVDDSGTVEAPQDTIEGDGDGDGGDNNDWTVFTTDAPECSVAVDGVSTGTTSGTSVTISHTTSGTDRLMLVGVSFVNDDFEEVVDPGGVTYNGVSLTREGVIVNQQSGGDDARVEIWSLVAPDTGTHDVVVTFDQDLAQAAVVGVMTFNGVDQATPLGTFAGGEAESSSSSVTVSSGEGELVFAVMGGETTGLPSADAPADERWSLSDGRTYAGGLTQSGASPNVTPSFSHSNDYWVVGAISIKPNTSSCGGSCTIAVDDTPSTGTTAAGISSMTISHTTSGTNRLMLVGVSINNDSLEEVVNPDGITYNGVALTHVGAVNHQGSGGDDSRAEIWSLVAPDTGTHDVVINFTAALQRQAVAGVMTFTGVDQTTPLGTFASNYGDGSTSSVTVTSDVGELVFAVMSGETTGAVSADAPATERWTLNEGTEYGAGATSDGASPDVTVSFSHGSDHWAAGGVSIKPASSCSGGPGIDHFAIVHDGTAVNCQAENVTIEAHESDHAVDTAYAGTISLSTSTKHGDWSLVSGSGSLTSGGKGNAVYGFSSADSGVVVLGLRDTFAETTNIDVSSMGMTEDPSEDDDLVFARSGFNFLADGAKNTIGVQIGGKPSNVAPGAQTLELQAVKTNDDTGACEAALVGSAVIDIGFECEDPTSCATNSLTFNGTNVPANDNDTVPTYARVSMDFGDATDDTATFTMTYDDVGKVKLHARNRLLPSGEEMMGGSNSFVVRPFAFDVNVIGNPAASDSSGGVFTSAGTNFTADVTALLWDAADDADTDGIADNHDDTDPSNNADLTNNAAALNYGKEFSIEQVLLTAALDQPSGGVNPGLSGGTNLTIFTNGTGTTTSLRYDEVGIIEITAKVADDNYLGIGATETAKIASKSGYVGRFNPAQYEVTASDINPACSATFTYARQPFTGSMTIEAQNGDDGGNTRTQNYRVGFVTLDPATELTFINSQTASAYDSKTVTYNQNFDSGNTGEAVLALQFRWDMPEQPPAVSTVQNTAVTDEVTTLVNAPVNIGSSPTRHGRLLVGTAAGSELVDLNVVMRTEYYLDSTNGYVVNGDDYCSTSATLSLANFTDNLDAGETCVQDTGNPGLSGEGCVVSGPVLEQYNDPLLAGDANLWLKAPGAGNDGSTTINADVPDWLEFDWDTAAPGLEDPTGHATFGIYGGAKNQIYRRELY